MSRYRTFAAEIAETYAFPVRKIALDAGFTCPNRDGVKARGGCVYCDNRSFAPGARRPLRPIGDQIAAARAALRRNGRDDRFIAYFQAYSNTYGPVDELRALYDRALAEPDVVGLSIATRPDCLPAAALDLLESYASRLPVWLEIGLESRHDRTLALLNRAHTFAEFEDAVSRSRGRGLRLVAHTIFGLPGESHADMMATADAIAAMELDGVKLHHLYVSRSTELETWWNEGRVRLLTLSEWASLAVDVMERLAPSMTIHRVMGEMIGPFVVAPDWGVSTREVKEAIDAEFARRGTRQGNRLESRAVRP